MALPFEQAWKAFTSQKGKAARRGIPWKFSFASWCDVWEASGKWGQRGVGRDKFCMGCLADKGAYELANVEIVTWQTNTRDACLNRPREELVAAGRAALGKGRGWTFCERLAAKPYQVVVSRKYIGCFATQGEAEAAYRAACAVHSSSWGSA